ncbi:MAG: hypothetical protein KGQ79_05580 [Proteobacteria bacterium]|nr:hypothetical protein [Pseudomonadota bacterium]
MKKPRIAQTAFDPYLERLVVDFDPNSDRIRAKLDNAYTCNFCELCWRPTEYSRTLDMLMVVKRLQRGNAKSVPPPDALSAAAQKLVDALVARYEQACKGEFGPYEAGRMLNRHCEIIEMRGDFSVDSFRDHVQERMLVTEWARRGELVRPTRLPRQPDGAAKPSKLYCEKHNPRRSEEARRAYQRDRRFAAEYEALIKQVWRRGINTATLPTWDIKAHAYVRKEAYDQLQKFKSPTKMIDDMLANATMNQAEIARQLGVSRQAVSAAFKRRAQKLIKC